MNFKVRQALAKNHLYQYQLADLLKVSEFTLIRRLRKELPDEEQDRIVQLIEDHCRGDRHADN